MGTVLTFGELLLRISPDNSSEWINHNKVSVFAGGAEANVATALAKWNIPVKYLTAAPDNFLAKQIIDYLTSLGINMSSTFYSASRIGLYYLSQGKDLKNNEVIYDRENSSFATLLPGIIDWKKVFEGVSWFHFSAICPALNNNVAAVCIEALEIANEMEIRISLDLNYRSKLWKYGKEPIEVMPSLAKYCDVIMGNIWSANKMLGTTLPDNVGENNNKQFYLDQAKKSSESIVNDFPKCRIVANTFRIKELTNTHYYGTLYKEGEMFYSYEYKTEKEVFPIGTGDCFMAGLIYGFYNNLSAQETLNFATAAAFNKFFIPGDATTSSIDNILKTSPF